MVHYLKWPWLFMTFTAAFGAALILSTLAMQGRCWICVGDVYDQSYRVREYRVIVQNNIVYEPDWSSVGSFLTITMANGDWYQVGQHKGKVPYDGFFPEVHYYLGWKENEVYGFQRCNDAPVGTNHEFMIYATRGYCPNGPWYALIDGKVYNTRYNFPLSYGVPSAQCESHDNQNQMEYHWWDLKYAGPGLNYWYFSKNWDHEDAPYQLQRVPAQGPSHGFYCHGPWP